MRLIQFGLSVLLLFSCTQFEPTAWGQNAGDDSVVSIDRPVISNYRPQVGQLHPDIVLPSIESRQAVSLSQFRGTKVLLIHFASW